MIRLNLKGQKFGRLKVAEFVEMKNNTSMFLCECECGESCIVRGPDLKIGHTISCGCYHKETISAIKKTHGLSGEKLYELWSSIKRRCNNKNSENYHRYGGRGIKMCSEWLHNPTEFIKWAKENGYKEGLSIDRKDNNGNYEPSNCKWSTVLEQARNKRNNIHVLFNGEIRAMVFCSKKLGIKYGTLRDRYQRGDRNERLLRPVENKNSEAIIRC